MNSKVIILSLNAIYLIATITWVIIDKSVESIVAITGGVVSFVTFFVANDNSFLVNSKDKKKQIVDNKKAKIGQQINVGGDYNENNN